ncbi:MAG TPA: G1 family glutamic endopeptidase [Coriobacteriia bacterium]
MKTLRVFLTFVLATTLLAALAGPAFAAPGIHVKNGTSTNWSGYAVETNLASPQSSAVSDVVGTWIVPGTTATSGNSYSSAWVGIDGYASNTVEQLGTEQDWMNGAPRYYAWWEMYPKASRLITTMSVRAGDQMGAEVKFIGKNTFMLTMTNFNTGQTFTTLQKANDKRSSAEWVMEAPWSGSVLPLAKFGSIGFTSCYATLNGHTGAIGDSAWQRDPITMVDGSKSPIAVPSSLTSLGSAFTVTRVGN